MFSLDGEKISGAGSDEGQLNVADVPRERAKAESAQIL